MRVMFQTDAGSMGLGHFQRSFALFQALQEYRCESVFSLNAAGAAYVQGQLSLFPGQVIVRTEYDESAIRSAANFQADMVILDSYRYSLDYVSRLRDACSCPIVEFDDFLRYPQSYRGDVVINGNIFANEYAEVYQKYFTKSLLGLDFLAMKPGKMNCARLSVGTESRVLLTCGGYDTLDIMSPLAEELSGWSGEVSVVVGPFFTAEQVQRLRRLEKRVRLIMSPRSLEESICQHDLIITAAGTTAYEVLRAGRKMVLMQTADNQAQTFRSLTAQGLSRIEIDRIGDKGYVLGILKAADEQNDLLNYPIYHKVDGDGALRIAKELKKVIEGVDQR